ncbi:DNA helicase RecG [candidate division WWE3 bacterium CG08_land_8_20_14_0_20_40_13]|uniref:DNA helicase RecG n=1 Tax=candidate division WWE3 bacterium CG08_land_8_20_14_0_20_40_13 TaxID=1975084 RepID=A0A2H0XE67_UNCKA|nr:MAG: DNA helicase RecG [candidate division WWE3 bacterium CG08_land_8_20_14_0_20_40_13]
MDFFSSVATLPLIGPRYQKLLKKLEIHSVHDLLYHFPFRYEDYSIHKKINQLMLGEIVTITGGIAQIKNIYLKSNKQLTKLELHDDTGIINCVFFNQHFLTRTLKPQMTINIAGKVDSSDGKLVFISPEYEIVNPEIDPVSTSRLVPVYPETAKLTSKWLRRKIYNLLSCEMFNDLEIIPLEFLNRYRFNNIDKSLRQIHFPASPTDISKTIERFSYEELFTTQLIGLVRRSKWQSRGVAKKISLNGNELLDFMSHLPFQLTKAQIRVCHELLTDISKNVPANRLIQGDVGSGKTVVAALAMYAAFKSGAGSILMAPTEVLAFQHFQTICDTMHQIDKYIPIELVTGSKKTTLVAGKKILVGTHALLYSKKSLGDIGLIVVDEQHKFGVEQRSKILSKVQATHTPHMITMTATPIPRSLCLTLFGDLDISNIDEMPQGRLPVKTFVVSENKRADGYRWIKKKIINENCQVFVVCPFIEDSQIETLKTIKSAVSHFELLHSQWFNDISIGLLHGRLKSKEKEKIINDFREGITKILVATPVVEVGMDIPNANIIVIEGAERFGLASLHQLRGRVGRRGKQAYCFLFPSKEGPNSNRLKIMEQTANGLILAEKDLEHRGPGELYGIKQSGKLRFRFADFSNLELLEKTYQDAKYLVENPDKFPNSFDLLNKLSPDTIAGN